MAAYLLTEFTEKWDSTNHSSIVQLHSVYDAATQPCVSLNNLLYNFEQ